MPLAETRDEQGRLIFDGDSRISRVLGMLDCDPAGGSINDPNLYQGAPWAICVPIEGYSGFDAIAQATASGSTVTYTASKKRSRLIYGTY